MAVLIGLAPAAARVPWHIQAAPPSPRAQMRRELTWAEDGGPSVDFILVGEPMGLCQVYGANRLAGYPLVTGTGRQLPIYL